VGGSSAYSEAAAQSRVDSADAEAPPTPTPLDDASRRQGASTLPAARWRSRGEGEEIDRGKEDHGFHFKKFEIRASPKRWLFSGWNWVPIAVSLPTIAVTGPP
jgi:hypothetical protein